MMNYNYKSPFEKLINDETETLKRIYDVVAEANENAIMAKVKSAGIEVDKDELIRALQYDRDQYNKGFRDGQPKWISVSERLPEKEGEYLAWRSSIKRIVMLWFTHDCYGWRFTLCEPVKKHRAAWYYVDENGNEVENDNVQYWMPLPEPPEVEE